MNLRWTDAGRAALAAAGHAGVAAVRLTHFAIGDGSGPGGAADDARATLRNERHRAAIAGTPATAGRIALRADLTPDASYSITEAGIFGTAGDPPSASQLLLYWTDSGAAAGAAAAGTDLALPAVIEFQNAAAEVAVTVGGNIVFGATEPATEAEFGSTRYATAEETGDSSVSARSVTPAGLHAAAGKVLATLLGSDPADGSVYQLKGTADGALVVELRTQDGESSAAIAGNAAAIAAMGVRVTAVEGKVFAVPAAGDEDKTYVIKRASSENGGGLSIVEAVFRRYVTPGTYRLTVPAGVTRLRVKLVGGGGGGGQGTGNTGSVGRFGSGGDGGDGGDTSATHRGTTHTASGGGGGRGGRNHDPGRGGAGSPDGSMGAWGGALTGGRGGSGGGNGGNGGGGADGYHDHDEDISWDAGSGGGGGGGGETITRTLTDLSPGDIIELVVGHAGTGGRGGGGIVGMVGGGGMVEIVNG